MKSMLPLLIFCIITGIQAETNVHGKRIYHTQHLNGAAPHIDGVLDDACWTQQGHWAGNYVQQQPYEGKAPSQKTELKILYDNQNIYVAIRAFDTEPEKIDRQIGRRDAFSGDMVGINFDSYHDHRTGFEFNLTAAGSKVDLMLLNSGWDTSWNAVWDGKTAVEDSAWTAEMRIPLSQLRYAQNDNHVWGLHAWRWINRLQEEDQWQLIPLDNPGMVYCFGELHGIRGLKPFRRVEVLPYTVAKTNLHPKESGNPFAAGHESQFSAGVDAKIGLSTNFTMDLTVNPDFGQVEADPSVMNLTAFETFYEEKRPFFLEGRNIFNYDIDHDQLFYSRRIGHKPGYTPDLNDGEYAKNPENTTILSALKITGKTPSGLSVGLLQSVTSREQVEIAADEKRHHQTSEPLSNYFVGRVQKDFNQSNTIFGGMLTAVNRDIQDSHLNFMNKAAYTGGMDFRHYFQNKTWFVDAKAVFSHLQGDAEAIQDVQKASARYFHRPDVHHIQLDTTRTTLSGHGGSFKLAKDSNGRWRFSESVSWRSPGLDLNDMGFMRRADCVTNETVIRYVMTEPGSLLRSYEYFIDLDNEWDFDQRYIGSDLCANISLTFLNKWRVGAHLERYFDRMDTRMLRGGPAMREEGSWYYHGSLRTDNSKQLSSYVYFVNNHYDDNVSNEFDLGCGLTWKAAQAMTIDWDMDYSHNKNAWQYISTQTVENKDYYILGFMNQKTLSLTFRIDLGLTPNLTIQYYGSPFVSAGQYNQFKRVTNPDAEKWQNRFRSLDQDEWTLNTADNHIEVNEAGGLRYDFEHPDFNFREFRSNLVLRYEYALGSTLYLVWTQNRNGSVDNGRFNWQNNMDDLFHQTSTNVFLFKINRWFSL